MQKDVRHTDSQPWVRGWKAGAPVRSSNAITPSAHASTAGEASTERCCVTKARTTSGAAYVSVNARATLSPVRAVQPKSITVQRFSRGSHITLAGLMSRCTYPASCMSASRADTCDSTCTDNVSPYACSTWTLCRKNVYGSSKPSS